MQMHSILDEIISGGQVLETSSSEVMKAVEEISKCSLSPPLSLIQKLLVTLCFKGLMHVHVVVTHCRLETASNSINFVSKTVSGWRG